MRNSNVSQRDKAFKKVYQVYGLEKYDNLKMKEKDLIAKTILENDLRPDDVGLRKLEVLKEKIQNEIEGNVAKLAKEGERILYKDIEQSVLEQASNKWGSLAENLRVNRLKKVDDALKGVKASMDTGTTGVWPFLRTDKAYNMLKAYYEEYGNKYKTVFKDADVSVDTDIHLMVSNAIRREIRQKYPHIDELLTKQHGLMLATKPVYNLHYSLMKEPVGLSGFLKRFGEKHPILLIGAGAGFGYLLAIFYNFLF